jgi:hypothetical protein
MILIVASIADEAAAAFAGEAAASLFTCYDLAVSKSALRYPDFHNSIISLKGKELAVTEITAVLNLLPAVFPGELFFYPEEEREYQSSEFHALLTFFLTALPCSVINRPSTMSLSGPYINPMRWSEAAVRAGIPLSKMTIENTHPPDGGFYRRKDLLTIECLGGTIISPSYTIADDYTRALVKNSNVEYLKVFYDREHFSFERAQSIPDVKDPQVRKLLINYLHV